MGKLIKKVLQDNIFDLNENLNCRTGILDRFLAVKPPIISRVEKEEIVSKTTPHQQNDALIMLLMTKDDRALDILHAYLKENGYTELVTGLEKSAVEHGHTFPGATSANSFAKTYLQQIREPTTSTDDRPEQFETPEACSQMEEPDNILLGIDLGTTYSCAGIWKDGKVTILINKSGNRITPSCVSFLSDGQVLVGDEARAMKESNPQNTIYEVKRLIGRLYEVPLVQADIGRLPFKVIPDKNGAPVFPIDGGQHRCYQAEEISSLILGKLKSTAEETTGCKVKDAVITVPANFRNSQREATKTAAEMAGLNVLQMVNEPTAAALAYGLDKKLKLNGSSATAVTDEDEKNVLVYDLGGGTFDVTILNMDINVEEPELEDPASFFNVVGTSGEPHLGGQDFDNLLVQYFLDEFERQHHVRPAPEDKNMMAQIRKIAEETKIILSSETATRVQVEYPTADVTLEITVTRTEFERLCEPLFQATIKCVDDLINVSCLHLNVKKFSIEEVVLIGGSTRIPRIRELLVEYFAGGVTEINWSLNPDEAVAVGATILAATLVPSQYALSDILLTDVTSLSLGVATEGYKMSTIIKRFTPLPLPEPAIRPYTTVEDNQETVAIVVYEGESELVKNNNKLGMFQLHGIPSAPKGVPIISVQFDIDASGILHVSATERTSGRSRVISVRREGSNWKQASEITTGSEQNSRMKFANYAEKVRRWLLVGGPTASGLPNFNVLLQTCYEAKQWLADYPKEVECDDRLLEFQRVCNLPEFAKAQLDYEK